MLQFYPGDVTPCSMIKLKPDFLIKPKKETRLATPAYFLCIVSVNRKTDFNKPPDYTQAAFEKANEEAEDIAKSWICRTIKASRPVSSSLQDLEDIIWNMKEKRMSQKKNYIASIHHSVIPITKFFELRTKHLSKKDYLKALSQFKSEEETYGNEVTTKDPRFDSGIRILSRLFTGNSGFSADIIANIKARQSSLSIIKSSLKRFIPKSIFLAYIQKS